MPALPVASAPCVALLAALALLGACADGPARRGIGDACRDDAQCLSGLCVAATCLDPEADDDGDGLSNSFELGLGTNPLNPDTDGDGKTDREELGPNLEPIDTDGDGIIDALESALLDADRDCIVDELDARNTIPDGHLSPRIPELCPTLGVCGAEGAVLGVMCFKGLDQPECDLRRVPGHETHESLCDGLDNDCDGQTDEGCGLVSEGLLGHWRLDGDGDDSGPWRDHGQVFDATPTADRFGDPAGALAFRAETARVAVPATRHPLGASDVTYTAWVRPDTDLRDALGVLSFGELEPGRRSGLSLAPTSPFESCAYHDTFGETAGGGACLPARHWSFLALVRSGQAVRLYLDGRLLSEGTLATAPDLRRSGLTIGAGRHLAVGRNHEPFVGAIDDVRLYGRALSPDDVEALFFEGDWAVAGTPDNPAQSCRHARDAAGMADDGVIALDPDGDGPAPAVEARCDQTTDGGGWTLAWRYGFTDAGRFNHAENAVTPVPDWPAPQADAPLSAEIPTEAADRGALSWELWEAVGTEFMVHSPMVGRIACAPDGFGEPSLATGVEGHLICWHVEAPLCDEALPEWVYFWDYGPGLAGESLFIYFDGSTVENWPTHDPCGLGGPPAESPPDTTTGEVWLR